MLLATTASMSRASNEREFLNQRDDLPESSASGALALIYVGRLRATHGFGGEAVGDGAALGGASGGARKVCRPLGNCGDSSQSASM